MSAWARRRWAVRKARVSGTRRGASCCRANRVMRLLDPGAPFLEVGALAAGGLYGDEAPAAGG